MALASFSFLDLPLELRQMILEHCDFPTLRVLLQTSRSMREVCEYSRRIPSYFGNVIIAKFLASYRPKQADLRYLVLICTPHDLEYAFKAAITEKAYFEMDPYVNLAYNSRSLLWILFQRSSTLQHHTHIVSFGNLWCMAVRIATFLTYGIHFPEYRPPDDQGLLLINPRILIQPFHELIEPFRDQHEIVYVDEFDGVFEWNDIEDCIGSQLYMIGYRSALPLWRVGPPIVMACLQRQVSLVRWLLDLNSSRNKDVLISYVTYEDGDGSSHRNAYHIASAMMQPDVNILDAPSDEAIQILARDTLNILEMLRRELGVNIFEPKYWILNNGIEPKWPDGEIRVQCTNPIIELVANSEFLASGIFRRGFRVLPSTFLEIVKWRRGRGRSIPLEKRDRYIRNYRTFFCNIFPDLLDYHLNSCYFRFGREVDPFQFTVYCQVFSSLPIYRSQWDGACLLEWIILSRSFLGHKGCLEMLREVCKRFRCLNSSFHPVLYTITLYGGFMGGRHARIFYHQLFKELRPLPSESTANSAATPPSPTSSPPSNTPSHIPPSESTNRTTLHDQEPVSTIWRQLLEEGLAIVQVLAEFDSQIADQESSDFRALLACLYARRERIGVDLYDKVVHFLFGLHGLGESVTVVDQRFLSTSDTVDSIFNSNPYRKVIERSWELEAHTATNMREHAWSEAEQELEDNAVSGGDDGAVSDEAAGEEGNNEVLGEDNEAASEENDNAVDELDEDAVEEEDFGASPEGSENAGEEDDDVVLGEDNEAEENNDAVDEDEDAVDEDEDAVGEDEDAVGEDEDAVEEDEDAVEEDDQPAEENAPYLLYQEDRRQIAVPWVDLEFK